MEYRYFEVRDARVLLVILVHHPSKMGPQVLDQVKFGRSRGRVKQAHVLLPTENKFVCQVLCMLALSFWIGVVESVMQMSKRQHVAQDRRNVRFRVLQAAV